jgi:hypothetical protein
MASQAATERILRQLTLEEKIAQLSGLSIFDLIDTGLAATHGGPAFDFHESRCVCV